MSARLTMTRPDQTPHALHMERRVYDAARQFITEHGYPPTVRELAALVGYRNASSVMVRLHDMRYRGYVNFVDATPRTLVLIRRP